MEYAENAYISKRDNLTEKWAKVRNRYFKKKKQEWPINL